MNQKFEWDVKIGDEIEFFDPTLSYEHTGYRPIDMERGLDFDKTEFVKVGKHKDTYGHYTKHPYKSKAYRDWWLEQFDRCLNGFEHNGYRITGDNYFFLNFYRLLNVSKVQVAGDGREETMPDFQSKQYEYFHYVRLCEILKRDVIALKARGVGFSEIAASLGVGKYTVKPGYKCIYTAYAEGFLLGDGILQKVWNNLEYLNQETEGAMRRIRQKIDTILHKRASKVDDQKQESGHKAEILGKTVDNPRKLRGGRYERIFFEEFGSDPIGITKWNQAEALVNIGGVKLGTRFAWGTGGDEGPYLAALEEMFLDPEAFGGLPYKHNHTKKGEYIYTGYFVAAHECVSTFTDERGVTDLVKAKEWYQAERKKKAGNPKNLLEYSSEYCFYPEEALSRQGQNEFNQEALAEQHTNLTILKTVPLPRTVKLFWNYEPGTNNKVGVKIKDDPNGDILMVEEPQFDDEGKPMRNLYIAGVDGIDVGEDESVVGKLGSAFAIVVKKRTFGNTGNKYVCAYKKRPKDVREAYEQAAKILWLYGCKANLEDTKIGFRTWLREKKLDRRMIMNRPSYALADGKRNDTLWGTPGSEKMIRHGLELVKEFIDDHWMNLTIVEIIEEAQKYSYVAKGKFDFISAMVMCEIGDEDMFDLRIVKESSAFKDWQDVGHYTDEYGVKRYGVIPGKPKFIGNFEIA